MNIIYTGIFYNREDIINKFKPVHENIFSHHSTIEFRPKNIDNLQIGKVIKTNVLGRLITDNVDCLLVENELSKNEYPHITLSTAKNIKPFQSNIEIKNNLDKIKYYKNNIIIEGVVGYFDGKVITDNNKKQLKESKMDIKNHPFINDVINNRGEIYYVGGYVRDSFLNKESKDIDILITNIPLDKLENILSKHGKVDSVGKSFGVLKFIPDNTNLDLDIAIPRKEKSTGDKYTDFEVVSDHNLSIEDDLLRRDFTINAIAKDINGNIIDPFNGRKDLQNKIIRMVNPKAFAEDPLRMLRAVQFASRFDFKIEPNTFKEIKNNSNKIKSISPERILIEFDKIIKKGNIKNGIDNIINSGLYYNIFNTKPNISKNINIENIKTMGEFIFTLCYNTDITNISDFYKKNLNGDISTTKEIKALEEIYNKFTNNRLNNLIVLFNTYSIYPEILNSKILDNEYNTYINEFKNYPKTIKELDINGNDIIKLGYKGSEIKNVFLKIIKAIFNNEIKNNKENIFKYINNTNNNLNESNNDLDKQKEEDIQDYVDAIDMNLDKQNVERYIKTLKDKYNYEYVRPEIRFQDDIKIINEIINKKYKAKTTKGFEFTFETRKPDNKDLTRSVWIDIFTLQNDLIGKVGFSINKMNKSIIIGGAQVNEIYRRRGIYTVIVDFIEDIANKYNLNIKEGSRSSDARAFWNNRINK